MLFEILQIINLILIIAVAVMLYINRNKENQLPSRILFVFLVILFVLNNFFL